MGPPPSMEQMTDMLSNPQFAQMMNEALQNPQLVDMMIQQNPQLRAMGPQARQFLQSDQFRQMITNPQALRSMAQLSRNMGMGPFAGGGGGQSAFPAPGITNTTPAENREAQDVPNPAAGDAQSNLFAALMGGAGNPGANPLAGLFNPALMNTQQQAPSNQPQPPSVPASDPSSRSSQTPQQNPFSMLFNPAMMGQAQTGTNPSNTNMDPTRNPFLPQNNPFLQDPASMNALLQAMGGAPGAEGAGTGAGVGAGANANPYQNLLSLLGGAGGAGGAGGVGGPPADSRPPEERFATQLRQLNEMGFFDFDRNIQALTRSGGDVNGALEWLFSQPG